MKTRRKAAKTADRAAVDLAWLVVLVVVVALEIVLPFINPEAKKAEEKTKTEGAVFFTIEWPRESHSDIDIWVQTPADDPVGYARKNGRNCDLLRDDLGTPGDPGGRNWEFVACRALVPGRWVVNLHWYSASRVREDGTWEQQPEGAPVSPEKVVLAVEMHKPEDDVRIHADDVEVEMRAVGEERTVLVFDLLQQGNRWRVRSTEPPYPLIPLRAKKG